MATEASDFLAVRYTIHARRTAETPARCDVPGGPSYRAVRVGLTFQGMLAEVESLEIMACDVRVIDEIGRRVSPLQLLRCMTGFATLATLDAEAKARAGVAA